MIVEDNYMGYDYYRHEYYLKKEAVVNLLTLEESEIDDMLPKVEKHLKRFSQRVYQYVYSQNTGANRQHIHFRIFKDLNGERQALLDAMLEYVMGAVQSGMDLNTYQDEQLNDMPNTAVAYLRNASLFNRPRYVDKLEYGEY